MSEKEPVVGVMVIRPPHPETQCTFEAAEINPATLAEMTRRFVEPLLTIEETEKKYPNFITVGGFATKYKRS